MATQNENSVSLIRSKHDKPHKHSDPYIKPANAQLTQRPQKNTKNNPVTIVIPPRLPATNSRQTTPTTPTKTTGKRQFGEATPTAHRIRRTPPDQLERTTPPEYNPTQPAGHDQPMDEDDIRSETHSQADSNTYQASDPPTPSQDQEGDQMMTEIDHLTDALLIALLNAEDIIIRLKQNGCLDAITKEEDITHALRRLSESIPILPVNVQLEPLLSGIGNLCQKVNSLTETLENQTKRSMETSALQDSIHAPTQRTPKAGEDPNTHTPKPASFSSAVQNGKTVNQQRSITTTNPRLSYHQTRIVAQLLPNGAPANNRRDPSDIVSMINAALTSSRKANHIKVVAATYNKQGNIILSTRADQTAAELAKHEDIIKPVLAEISGTEDVVIREDKKWFKIQIDGVNTGTLTIGEGRATYSGKEIHDELMLCNPLYLQLTKHIVAIPRWLRTKEEIQTIPRSSLVIAFDDEQAAKNILNLKALAAFGRHCSMRAFQERPPVTQCRKCWRFDHTTDHCNGETCCRPPHRNRTSDNRPCILRQVHPGTRAWEHGHLVRRSVPPPVQMY